MRKNQKGFTLVELIIAVAILAIVTLSVCGFIVVGSRSYTSANTDIMLQQEAQLALNQISDVIIDTTESINYGSGTEMVLKDTEFSSEPDEKDLVVINGHGGLAPTDSSLQNNNLCYQFEWRKDTETIYFRDSEAVITESHPKPDEDEWNDWAILAQHVKELHIDISQFEENRVVMISMTFQNGNKEYTTSNNVTVRNRVAINKIDIEPMKKAQDFTIMTVDSVILEPGDTFNLADKTQVFTTSDDDAVRWELVDPGITTSTISLNGQLSIGTSEDRQSFLVRVSRENEEYENQNKKVAETVTVNIKRVKSVDLSGPATTVKAGDTITINGFASGTKWLGYPCEAHLGDDKNKDRELVPTTGPEGWEIVGEGAKWATIVKSDEEKAEIKIASTAPAGKIFIKATSYLSTIRSYGIVTGTWTLDVTEGTNGAKYIGSELKFGTDNDPGIFDYMRTSLKTDHGRYIFCIRVREAGTVGCQNDYIMVYFTQGANERFSPDAFGLDLTKSYEVYFQVLDPRPKGSRDEASKQVIIQEYTNPNNLDDNGKYIGDMFEADEYYYGMLNPPSVAVTINGVTYPNDEKDNYEYFSFLSTPNQNPLSGMINIADAGAINIWREAVLNNIRFTVYKEENGRWKRVYGYAHDTEEYADYRNGTVKIGPLGISPDGGGNFGDKGNYTGQRTFGRIEFQPGEDPTVKNLSNSNAEEMKQACGVYHIVPGYVYANNPNIREGAYTGDNIIIKKLPNKVGDFKTYYYKQWDCAINLKIDMGFNIELPEVNGEKRWSYFPTPKDRAFPFDLRSENEQSANYSFTQYNENYENKGTLGDGNVIVSCTYDAAEDEYTIKLKDIKINGKQVVTHIYGIYTYNADDDKWDRYKEEYNKTETTETNLTFNKKGETYDTYFPTPLKGDFPFRSNVSGEQVRENWQLIEFKQKDGSTTIERCTVKCTYADDVYSIQLIATEKTNTNRIHIYNYGTFTCGRYDTKWVYQDGTGWYKEGTDLNLNIVVTFDRNPDGQKYDSFFPAPTDGSFPISGSKYKLQMYNHGDLDCQYYQEREVTAVYSNGELELRDEEYWGNNIFKITCYGKYQYNEDTKQWEQKDGYSEYKYKKWKTLTYFTINNKEYQAEIPLPGDSDFPTFTNSDIVEENKPFTYYEKGNISGDGGFSEWGCTWRYIKDNEGGYQLEISNGQVTFKFKYGPNEKEWTRVE